MENANKESWKQIDDGLMDLMVENDTLCDGDLHVKARRLLHLARFCKSLSQRVNERLQEHVKPGDIDSLFVAYHQERKEIDSNA